MRPIFCYEKNSKIEISIIFSFQKFFFLEKQSKKIFDSFPQKRGSSLCFNLYFEFQCIWVSREIKDPGLAFRTWKSSLLLRFKRKLTKIKLRFWTERNLKRTRYLIFWFFYVFWESVRVISFYPNFNSKLAICKKIIIE